MPRTLLLLLATRVPQCQHQVANRLNLKAPANDAVVDLLKEQVQEGKVRGGWKPPTVNGYALYMKAGSPTSSSNAYSLIAGQVGAVILCIAALYMGYYHMGEGF
jgi:hypothetical protein